MGAGMKAKKTTENVTVEIKYRHLMRTPRHEAGHTLLALVHSMPFEYVTIVPNDASRGHIMLRSIALHMVQVREYAQYVMGGLAGERVNWSRPGSVGYAEALRLGLGARDLLGRPGGDYLDAMEITTDIGLEGRRADSFISVRFREAWRLVKLYADVHTKLVEALLSKGTVSYKECSRVWKDRRDKGRSVALRRPSAL